MKKFFIFLSLLVFSLVAVSCGSDDEDGNDVNVTCGATFNINAELSDEINAFTNAAITYGNDPTPENCQAYKAAAQGYLEALESLRDCAEQVGELVSYNQALADLEAAIDDITC
jgi:ABC-type Zn uptake system ZnuABC Zn-binding protein ZnuA